jgi:hypothetical protein
MTANIDQENFIFVFVCLWLLNKVKNDAAIVFDCTSSGTCQLSFEFMSLEGGGKWIAGQKV